MATPQETFVPRVVPRRELQGGANPSDLEPVSGIEPLACRLQEARPPAPMRASCTDSTGHRTDGTRSPGIIWRAGPRTGPRPRRLSCPVLLLCVTSLRAPSSTPASMQGRPWTDGFTDRSSAPRYIPIYLRKHHRTDFGMATLSAICTWLRAAARPIPRTATLQGPGTTETRRQEHWPQCSLPARLKCGPSQAPATHPRTSA